MCRNRASERARGTLHGASKQKLLSSISAPITAAAAGAWTLDYKEEWPLDAPGFVHVDLCTGLQILVTRDSGSGGAADSSEPSVVRASAGEKAEEAGDSRRAGEKARRGLGFSGRVGLGADRTTAYCSCVCRCRVKLSQPRRRGLRRLAIRKPLNRATMRVAAA